MLDKERERPLNEKFATKTKVIETVEKFAEGLIFNVRRTSMRISTGKFLKHQKLAEKLELTFDFQRVVPEEHSGFHFGFVVP